ncbi:hypothetical protein ALI144C_20160 [Actinosynnema sp. ALI-1.44]|uniref:hypothetical protein n=1 Tax=Actinosynnema sp. ALI-1.44 TaxID=1933779 RepID=UPI00097BB331|nr:hypothetical protein [Actinosynnema sp. ALI-1.44]ONI81615.1 hypothetical protein ALI144C_20160 [Actinosynnema sp. ALI-1.44]
MEPLELEFGKVLFRYDRGIFEVFSLPPTSLPDVRVPVRWLGVRLDFFKGKTVKGSIRIGTIKSPTEPLFARLPDKLELTYTYNPGVRVQLEDEPLLRQYFTEVATRADRTVE